MAHSCMRCGPGSMATVYKDEEYCLKCLMELAVEFTRRARIENEAIGRAEVSRHRKARHK